MEQIETFQHGNRKTDVVARKPNLADQNVRPYPLRKTCPEKGPKSGPEGTIRLQGRDPPNWCPEAGPKKRAAFGKNFRQNLASKRQNVQACFYLLLKRSLQYSSCTLLILRIPCPVPEPLLIRFWASLLWFCGYAALLLRLFRLPFPGVALLFSKLLL